MSNSNSSSIGFLSLLTILFIGLKLGGIINWNWFLVLSPLVLSFCLVMFSLFVLIVLTVVKSKRDSKVVKDYIKEVKARNIDTDEKD